MSTEESAGLAHGALAAHPTVRLRAGTRSARARREQRIGMVCLAVLLLAVLAFRSVSYAPSAGGRVVLDFHSDSHFINPLMAYTDTDLVIDSLLFPGLLQWSTAGTLEPDLAQSWTESAGGRVFVVHLRTGLRWQTGASLTSRDVAATLGILNSGSSPIEDPAWRGVQISTNGAGTIVFRLPRPDYTFPSQLTVGIMPTGAIRAWRSSRPQANGSPWKTPVGDGPYSFTAARADGITVSRDPRSLTSSLLTRIAFRTAGSPHADSVSCVRSFVAKGGVGSVPVTNLLGLELNVKTLPQQDVRKALLASIEQASSTTNPLPVYPDIASQNTIPAGKKTPDELLRAAGWKHSNGVWTRQNQTLTVRLAAGASASLTPYVNLASTIWRRLGIRVSITRAVFPNLVRKVLAPGDFDVAIADWDFGSPDYNPRLLWGHNSALDFSNQNNRLLNTVLNRVARSPSPKVRDAERHRAGDLLVSDGIATGLAPERYNCAVASAVHGFELPVVVADAGGIDSAIESTYVSSRIVFHDPF